MNAIPRRNILIGGAALALGAPFLLSRPRSEAEFTYKFGCITNARHPVTANIQRAAAKIREASGGRLNIQVFSDSQLGSEADMLTQLRAGALEFASASGTLLSSMMPAVGASATGFAFANHDDVWRAMDGDLGSFVRTEAGRGGIHLFDRVWDSGFFQIMSADHIIRTPADLQGFRLRVPMGRSWIRLYKSLGAAPVGLPWSETYTALQTRVVDGVDAGLPAIRSGKIYEVQKVCTLTSHIWDGWWMAANMAALQRLPASLQDLIAEEFDAAARIQRAESEQAAHDARTSLTEAGIVFQEVDRSLFQQALARSGYYRDWKARLGAAPWALLERSIGKRLG
ncbi:MAG: TRAP transporter substrate-binding protein [Rhizorhabdus sp.]|jgi:tripartite ATP-independent transporter DctP family solute receptor|nr:MAG: TRAP transporter substrate-binding protein [Rhizorhabdus sp.]